MIYYGYIPYNDLLCELIPYPVVVGFFWMPDINVSLSQQLPCPRGTFAMPWVCACDKDTVLSYVEHGFHSN